MVNMRTTAESTVDEEIGDTSLGKVGNRRSNVGERYSKVKRHPAAAWLSLASHRRCEQCSPSSKEGYCEGPATVVYGWLC